LFVRGLAKAVTSTNATASVFGISDPNSAFDLLKLSPKDKPQRG